MGKVALKFYESANECMLYINGKRVEVYTYEEGQVVLSAVKEMNRAELIDMEVSYEK